MTPGDEMSTGMDVALYFSLNSEIHEVFSLQPAENVPFALNLSHLGFLKLNFKL